MFCQVYSLGWFCGVALDLEQYGLRSSSGPFDWVLSDLSGVMDLLKNGFEGILCEENMSQSMKNANIYKDVRYGIEFYHDFNGKIALEKQIERVKLKYENRGKRFLASLYEPTLLIRYVKDEMECDYLSKHGDEIQNYFCSYCKNNRVIYIVNSDLYREENWSFSNKAVFVVEKDKDDSVARIPSAKNKEIEQLFSGELIDPKQRIQNMKYREIKLKKKKSNSNLIKRLGRKIEEIVLPTQYCERQY